ncbi:MAG: DNA-3-methyladenine glycosylase I [Geothermobacteraceae bacterium]
MQRFVEIYQRAAERKGGEEALRQMLPDCIKSPEQLAQIGDDRYLAEMTRAIFKAGFVWKVIDKKWAGFEAAFWNFDVDRCACLSPDDEDALCADARIIRNRQKILTVPHNAVMVKDIRERHGSFGRFVADWPEDDFIGPLACLGKHGSRLGGMTAQYFLRFIGKDGFVLSRDGVYALIQAGVIDRPPTGKSALRKVQDAYNQWRQETGLRLADISRILGLSVDAPKD